MKELLYNTMYKGYVASSWYYWLLYGGRDKDYCAAYVNLYFTLLLEDNIKKLVM